MKRSALFVLAFVSVMLAAGAASANRWECVNSGSTSSSPKAVCYVSYVRYYPGAKTYVKAKLHDPLGRTGCSYVRVSLGSGSSGPGSVEEVRGSLSMLLTALTTGLPIKFYRLTSYGSSSDCYAGAVILSKPGH
jgi:hypothetical protein